MSLSLSLFFFFFLSVAYVWLLVHSETQGIWHNNVCKFKLTKQSFCFWVKWKILSREYWLTSHQNSTEKKNVCFSSKQRTCVESVKISKVAEVTKFIYMWEPFMVWQQFRWTAILGFLCKNYPSSDWFWYCISSHKFLKWLISTKKLARISLGLSYSSRSNWE